MRPAVAFGFCLAYAMFELCIKIPDDSRLLQAAARFDAPPLYKW